MSKVINSYILATPESTFIQLPIDYKILSVGLENKVPYLYVLCDSDLNLESVGITIKVFCTDTVIDDLNNLTYIGTLNQVIAQHYFES